MELERVVQTGFNSTGNPLFEELPIIMETFPYIVVIVDEMADFVLLLFEELPIKMVTFPYIIVIVGEMADLMLLLFERLPIKMVTFPCIIVIVGEMEDLMLVVSKEIYFYAAFGANGESAAGIYIIMGTQRPSEDVITGVIEPNFPTRISFAVIFKIDNRTILGVQGAEQLLGMGDMIYAFCW